MSATPQRIADFIDQWVLAAPGRGLDEEQRARQHFIGSCQVLDVDAPSVGDDCVFVIVQAHGALDHAVAAAHGRPDCTPAMADTETLRRRLALNLERSA